jgi:hypothetical protein
MRYQTALRPGSAIDCIANRVRTWRAGQCPDMECPCQFLRFPEVAFAIAVAFSFFRAQSEQQSGQVLATIDQSDIRGSKPHNHDPSGAASD